SGRRVRGRPARAPHRLDGARQPLASAREAEADAPLAVGAEIDPRHAADPGVSDQELGHAPRGRLARAAEPPAPLGTDAKERVERAAGRRSREDAVQGAGDALIEQVAAGPQLRPERLDAVLRPLEGADAAVLDDRG